MCKVFCAKNGTCSKEREKLIKILIVIMVLVVSVRTFLYGVWTIRQKNLSGGIMVQFLAVSSLALSVYFMLKT